MEKAIFKINGIQNDTEKIQLKKALDKIEGVREIAVDKAESTVEVEYNEPATESSIRECIQNTGHEIQ